jgi:hypothetical protein
MFIAIENTTRLFSVVGAPYIAEGHADDDCGERHAHSRHEAEGCAAAAPSARWWLDDDR